MIVFGLGNAFNRLMKTISEIIGRNSNYMEHKMNINNQQQWRFSKRSLDMTQGRKCGTPSEDRTH